MGIPLDVRVSSSLSDCGGLLRLRLFFRAILAHFLKIYDSRHLPKSGDAALRGQNDCIGEVRFEVFFNIEFYRVDIREVFSRVNC